MAAFQIGLFILVWALFSKAHAGPIASDLKPLHAVNRLAFGPGPGELRRVSSMGIEEYLREQLSPDAIALPSRLTSRLNALSTLGMTPAELFAEYNPPPAGKKGDPEAAKLAQQRARIVLEEATASRIFRAVESPRQLEEVMVNFWFNHFRGALRGRC